MSTKTELDTEKKERIRKYGEVFTPQETVNQMCDMLEAESTDAFDIEKTFLEPCCGDGVFVLEILRRKFRNCKTKSDYLKSLASVWAMDIQEQNVAATIANICVFCEKYFKPTRSDYQMISEHVILCDSLKVMKMMNELNEKENSMDTYTNGTESLCNWNYNNYCLERLPCGYCKLLQAPCPIYQQPYNPYIYGPTCKSEEHE